MNPLHIIPGCMYQDSRSGRRFRVRSVTPTGFVIGRYFGSCDMGIDPARLEPVREKPARQPKPDRPMFADDMFIENTQQVFSVRTGEFIGYYTPGEDIPDVAPAPPTEEKEPEIPNQTILDL
jgi:hypothetical protein